MALAALCAPAAGYGQFQVDRRIAIAHDASIRVLNLVGSIRVVGWDRDSLAVSGKLPPYAGKLFYFGGSGRAAKLGVDAPDGAEPAAGSSLVVYVPQRAKLWIKAATADIEVSAFHGTLDLYSVSGVIRVSGAPAQVYAESMDGRVEITGPARWVRAKTASGPIALRGGGEDVAATTVGGTIVVDSARITRGRFESVTGDIRFDGDLDRGASLTFESHSGAIELQLPGAVSADFRINEFQGEIVNELSRARSRTLRERGGRELEFTAGQGGADVTIRNFKGPVLLRRKH
jgi:hypothetical protein